MFARGLVPLSIASVVLVIGAFALVFFYAPNDADQGFIQKIFYLHVPLAIVALGGFVAGGWFGLRHLRSGDRADDLRSYVAIHLSLILGVGVLATGAIWAEKPRDWRKNSARRVSGSDRVRITGSRWVMNGTRSAIARLMCSPRPASASP